MATPKYVPSNYALWFDSWCPGWAHVINNAARKRPVEDRALLIRTASRETLARELILDDWETSLTMLKEQRVDALLDRARQLRLERP